MQIDGIHHVALNVKDLDRAERFYTDVLGFQVTHRFTKGLKHLMMDTGNSAIALFEAPDLDTQPSLELLSETGYLHLAFKASKEQMATIVQELGQHNVSIGDGPVWRGDGESIYFNDPDFNHLEIHCQD